ncbi:bifunctional glycogen debranching protein GlgX/4-alpha-glucanotransferase [Sporomusa sp.]|uniref:bifunctional glycogen debranching protein GlgX/4-alpha-glucanotransferase n=1 Tax=Sporomusa sp. TaxID=2078658 RepID=UPI002C9F5058|nr:bifunctional glycogen debranching protein GlgX/4-alpha-glucanotransferase [Sporomusa sp.]HWR06509.1 bifunctional glycogen debranching protein GlgX/4-alpha-glucanotransferase [Sporomusa sp.]
MNQYWILHDSHNADFRSPFGAVSCHTEVTLRLLIATPQHYRVPPVESVTLRQWQEGFGETITGMRLVQDQGGQHLYQAEIVASEVPGVIWYYFIVRQGGQTFYYGNNIEETGGVGRILDSPPPSYQISTYHPGAVTPYWFKHAIVYQIFVDRFYNGLPQGGCLNPRPGSLLHADWQDTPVYTRDMDTGAILAYDFFGGNLAGVIAKLPYLEELGITAIYFNPVFASPSNHKYDTADYKTIDPMFGDNKLFAELCTMAKERGIAVILDGVFSHTGSDSIYFNQDNNYESVGAYQSRESPYYSWYKFTDYPDKFESWWGIGTLPNVNETDPSYQSFIIDGADSVLKQWLKLGIKGWRLDVADELPEAFLKKFYQTLKATDPDAVLIGEVWEDASHKVAYGYLRQYFNGTELDSVMNYPFRKLVLDFMLGWRDAQAVHRALFSLFENYPKENFYANLNIIGSHDVPRILTLLGEAPPEDSQSKIAAFKYRLSPEARVLGLARLKLVMLWQMTFPGAPCIYYGDEAGVEGYTDPLNRRTYPWGQEDQGLLAWCKQLTGLRRQYPVLRTGEWLPLMAEGDVYGYVRRSRGGKDVFGDLEADNTAVVVFNRNTKAQAGINIDAHTWFADQDYVIDALSGELMSLPNNGQLELTLPPLSGRLLLGQVAPVGNGNKRISGVLLHPTSLPSPLGIGDLGLEAYRFVDFLAKAGQQLWQFLPLNPVGFGESPYQCLSAFAGNPLLIAPEKLVASGWLKADELPVNAFRNQDNYDIDFPRVKLWKEKIFRMAFDRFRHQEKSKAYQTFLKETAGWLSDYTLFVALKKHFCGLSWNEWGIDISWREAAAMDYYRQVLDEEIEYQMFLQFVFCQQWQELKKYANDRGIRLFGDLPLFVAHDSADVWANPQLFELDAAGSPFKVAGVPPDYFSNTGQLWGNPLYKWAEMEKDDYHWWRQRLNVLLQFVDVIRIDHFRGFEAYWEIPAGELTAVNGRWVAGPGSEFFAVMEKYLGKLPLVAEDLGVITPGVNRLKHRFGYPGMKVLPFSFGDGWSAPDFPHNTGYNTIAYTGTHDNDTLLGWYQKLDTTEPHLKHIVLEHLRRLDLGSDWSETGVCEQLVRLTYLSKANTVIIPLQDVLGLDGQARMNTPGTVGGNWGWRLMPGMLTDAAAERLAGWTKAGGRS